MASKPKPLKSMAVLLLLVFILISSASCGSTKEVQSHLKLHRTFPSGAAVAVFDDLLLEETQSHLRNYANFFLRWEVGGLEEPPGHCEVNQEAAEHPAGCRGIGETSPSIPWSGSIDPKWFSSTLTWQRLHEAVKHSHSTEGGDSAPQVYHPYRVRAEMLRRGDSVIPSQVSSSSSLQYARDLGLRIFLIPEWQKNDYGDMSFYTAALQNRTNGSRYDILMTVRPHPGRIVVWDTSIPTLYRPPSTGYLQTLLSVSVWLTPSQEKYETACKEWKVWDQMKNVQMEQPFPQLTKPVGHLDVSTHLTRSFSDSKGRKVMVFDGLFDDEHLDALSSYLIENPRSRPFPYSLERNEESDNAVWIKTFDFQKFASSSTWEVLSQAVSFIGGDEGVGAWHPYDVSVNVVRSVDHTRVHEDCEEYEQEFTMVLYLNRDIGVGDYGETIFYNREPLDDYSSKLYEGISMYDYDAIGAVNPKYGRLAVFNGLISHAARPPSTAYSGVRYTFAVKVSRSRKIALMKKLREMLEDNEGYVGDESPEELLEELTAAERNGGQTDLSEEWLETELTRVKDEFRRTLAERESKFMGSL